MLHSDAALAAQWDVSRMCARSKMGKQLEAMVIATAGMDDDVDSNLDDDDDSVDTAILDEEEAKDTNAFLFRKASSNDSVTTLDTRLGRPKSSKSKVVHKIDGSPPKRQKANQSNLTRKCKRFIGKLNKRYNLIMRVLRWIANHHNVRPRLPNPLRVWEMRYKQCAWRSANNTRALGVCTAGGERGTTPSY